LELSNEEKVLSLIPMAKSTPGKEAESEDEVSPKDDSSIPRPLGTATSLDIILSKR
jgi:hypothetical protein